MYTRLNKVGVCISHRTVVRLVNKIGTGHDKMVLKWKNDLEGRFSSITTASEDLENSGSNESDSLYSSDDNSTDHNCINYMAFTDDVSLPKAKQIDIPLLEITWTRVYNLNL